MSPPSQAEMQWLNRLYAYMKQLAAAQDRHTSAAARVMSRRGFWARRNYEASLATLRSVLDGVQAIGYGPTSRTQEAASAERQYVDTLRRSIEQMGLYVLQQDTEAMKKAVASSEEAQSLAHRAHALIAEVAGGVRPGRQPIPEEIQRAVWARDRHRCRNCGAPPPLQIDHILPVSRGGSNDLSNLQLLCRRCNQRKGARI